jgi:putative membrane protein
MNNIAAAFVANAGFAIGIFGAVDHYVDGAHAPIAISCVLCSAMVAHAFSESITSTFLGIPAEDTISVLPAHRLAKAGLGLSAVVASANGSIAGVVVGTVLLLPVCLVMGEPIGAYSVLRGVMGFIILFLSSVMLASDVIPLVRASAPWVRVMDKLLKAIAVFLCSGILGLVVLRTNFSSCSIPDFPWFSQEYVPSAALLLPLFAGLFGIPSLLLSLHSRDIVELPRARLRRETRTVRVGDLLLSVLGGLVVGWLPGMTSGSTASLCSPSSGEVENDNEVAHALRFIWLYSAISAVGAVFAVGALFTIGRARSGTMEAVSTFLGDSLGSSMMSMQVSAVAIILSMVSSACISYWLIRRMGATLGRMRRLLCSRRTALVSMLFVVCLSSLLTGTRGVLLLATAATLGLIPPRIRVRRIQLMGCLLVPIIILFLVGE